MNKNNSNFEILLEKAAAEAEKELEKELTEPDFDIRFSKEHEEKMQRFFQPEKSFFAKTKLFSLKTACILLVCFALSSVAVFNADALRSKFLSFLFDPDSPGTSFVFRNDGSTSYAYENLFLEYVPQGFEVSFKNRSSRTTSVRFIKDGKYVTISLDAITLDITIDTENATMETVDINGNEAMYFSNARLNSLIWNDDTSYYIIQGDIAKEEILKIAYGMKKIE